MTEYFVIITVSTPAGAGGVMQGTFTFTLDAGPKATRAAIYEHAVKQIPDQFQGGNVAFFSAEPNRLGVAS